ncbi:hypothetical protein Vretifemale_20774, partial [Volvox reticuliferus]
SSPSPPPPLSPSPPPPLSPPPPPPSLPSSPALAGPPPSSLPPLSPAPAVPRLSSPPPDLAPKFRFSPPPPPPPPPLAHVMPPLPGLPFPEPPLISSSPPQSLPSVPHSAPVTPSASPKSPLPFPSGSLFPPNPPVIPIPQLFPRNPPSPPSLPPSPPNPPVPPRPPPSPPNPPSPPSPPPFPPNPPSPPSPPPLPPRPPPSAPNPPTPPSPQPSSPNPPSPPGIPSPNPPAPSRSPKPSRKPRKPARFPNPALTLPPSPNHQLTPPLPPNQRLIIEIYIVVIDASGGLTVLEVTTILKGFKEKAARAHGVPVSRIFISEVWIDGEDITSGLLDHRRSLVQELWQHDSETPYNNVPRPWSAMEINSAFGNDASDVIHLSQARRFAANDPIATVQALEAFEEVLFSSLSSSANSSPGHILSNSDSGITSSSVVGGIVGVRQLVERDIPITSDDGSVLSLNGKLTIEYVVLSYEDVPQPPSPPPPSPRPPNPPGIKNPPRPPRNPTMPKPPPRVPNRPTPFNSDTFIEELGAAEVYHVLRPPSAPQQPPSPSLPPSQPPKLTTFIHVNDMPGHGAKGATRPIVWWDDPDFGSQLRPYKALQLVDWNKRPCPILLNVCRGCTRAWRAQKASTVVTVFFREPVQIDEIKIIELKHPSVSLVRLLAWPINPTSPSTPAAGRISYDYLGSPVYNATANSPTGMDPTKCNDALIVTLPPNRAGTLLPVPEWGSQENLPNRLSRTAVAGVEVTVQAPHTPALATFIESIRFKGRVLYPKDPGVYEVWV